MNKQFLMLKTCLEHISKLILVGKRPRQLPTSEFRPNIWLFQDRFKSCFDTAKRKISARGFQIFRNYWNRKQKHIRGDKTLKIWNFGPNVAYSWLLGDPPDSATRGGDPWGDHRTTWMPRRGDRRGEPDTISQPVDPGGVGGFFYINIYLIIIQVAKQIPHRASQ